VEIANSRGSASPVGAGSVATTCSPCDLPDEIIAKCDAMLLFLQNVLAFDGGILSGSQPVSSTLASRSDL
jgi:hypothetical protein